MNHCDIFIAGLGSAGSAALCHLARRGTKVLGCDRFAPPHTLGSSLGESRIIREAYFEHPLYVPLVQRAYQLWEALQQETGETLFRQTGGLTIGPPDGVLYSGALRSAQTYQLPYRQLSQTELAEQFPALNPPVGSEAIWEPRAGILYPEKCIQAHLALARRAGAEIRVHEPLLSWQADGQGVRIETTGGTYLAERLILAAGAWMSKLLPSLPLVVTRQVLFWFDVSHQARFQPEAMPIFILQHGLDRFCYGFPDLGHGVKVGVHDLGEPSDPDALERQLRPGEAEAVAAEMQPFMPGLGPLTQTAFCMYTNTPDTQFILDFHPAHPQILLASPCSGHGFKFSPVLGEVLADLALAGRSPYDLSLFRLDRFSPSPGGLNQLY